MGEDGLTEGYHDSSKGIINSRLRGDLESDQLAAAVSEVLAEGRLKVLATFSDDLSRIKERIEFLKVVKHYLDARKGPAEAKPKMKWFTPRRPTPLEEAINTVSSEIRAAEFELGNKKREARRAERMEILRRG